MAERLDGLVRRERLAHAYIFAGPPGIGKRRAAIGLARRWICPRRGCGTCADCGQLDRGVHPHVIQVKPTEGRVTITIQQVLDLQRELLLRPLRPLPRVALIDPAEAMSEPAMNSLLKILEEPPDGVTLILLAKNTAELLPTVRSRCHIILFFPASEQDIKAHLRESARLTPADVDMVAALSGGSFGEATRLAHDIENLRSFVHGLFQSVAAADFSQVIDKLIKSKETSETRDRARLAFQVLALAHRDALLGRPSPVPGTPDRWLRGIETLLEHQVFIDMNAHPGLTVVDALLQVM